MEAIFAPIQDVPDAPARDALGTVWSESAVDGRRFEGDYAAGLRLRPRVCQREDFATGLRVAAVNEQPCDFATGLRTCDRTELNQGDFATGQRRGDVSPAR
jgi:hypothetical protein